MRPTLADHGGSQPESYFRTRFGAPDAVMTLDEGGWRRPNLQIVTPSPVLRDVVEFFWIDEWADDLATRHSFRIVADDAPHILWYVSGDRVLRTQRLAVAGSRAWYHDANLSGRRVMAGARLVAGAIPMLFGIPAFAVTNRSVPIGELESLGSTARVRPMRVATRSGLVDDLSSLIDGMRRRRIGDSRSAWVASGERAGTTTVASFSRMFDMPPRSVRAWSARTLGLGLKRLLKIRRLHAALELRLSKSHDTWGQVAAAAGYADQSHLIRDCRLLLGESPSAFLARSC
jgi:AraC-like DNA-binding protein